MRGRIAEVVLGCSGHYIDPKLVARRIELSCSRVRITRTSVGEIVYESLFVLEIVNSTSVAQKTKMIPITHNNRGGGCSNSTSDLASLERTG